MAARRGNFCSYRLAGVLACLIAVRPGSVSAATISDTDFAGLAARCAPGVPVWVLRGVARTESDFHPWMLHDNSTHASDSPASLAAAETEAAAWMAEGHSVDLGLMQINTANLPALGMTIGTALDPCASLAGGAAVLRAAYGAGPVDASQQAALLMALSIYNTGSPLKGIMNGYARKVMRHADEVALPFPSHRYRPLSRRTHRPLGMSRPPVITPRPMARPGWCHWGWTWPGKTLSRPLRPVPHTKQ